MPGRKPATYRMRGGHATRNHLANPTRSIELNITNFWFYSSLLRNEYIMHVYNCTCLSKSNTHLFTYKPDLHFEK